MNKQLLLSDQSVQGIEEWINRSETFIFHDKIAFFDIDDTLIDSTSMQPIPSTIRIYRLLQSKGVRMVIITAREHTSVNLEWTQNQLESHGLFYHKLYLRPDSFQDLYQYKELCRELEVLETRRRPVCSVGDQQWDIGPKLGGIPILVVPSRTYL